MGKKRIRYYKSLNFNKRVMRYLKSLTPRQRLAILVLILKEMARVKAARGE